MTLTSEISFAVFSDAHGQKIVRVSVTLAKPKRGGFFFLGGGKLTTGV